MREWTSRGLRKQTNACDAFDVHRFSRSHRKKKGIGGQINRATHGTIRTCDLFTRGIGDLFAEDSTNTVIPLDEAGKPPTDFGDIDQDYGQKIGYHVVRKATAACIERQDSQRNLAETRDYIEGRDRGVRGKSIPYVLARAEERLGEEPRRGTGRELVPLIEREDREGIDSGIGSKEPSRSYRRGSVGNDVSVRILGQDVPFFRNPKSQRRPPGMGGPISSPATLLPVESDQKLAGASNPS